MKMNKAANLEAALFRAAKKGNTDDVKWLIIAGADVNAQDNFAETALMGVAGSGNAETVNCFLPPCEPTSFAWRLAELGGLT